jgi:hypothetical protein
VIRLWPPVVLLLAVVTVFWKLVLTGQCTLLENPDLANQVPPWLEDLVVAIGMRRSCSGTPTKGRAAFPIEVRAKASARLA